LKAFHSSLVGQQAAFGSEQRQCSPSVDVINVVTVHSATIMPLEGLLCMASYFLLIW
jgi:hypothetical protein